MFRRIMNEIHDEERAFYHLEDATVVDCTFAGPADGESSFKEGRNLTLDNVSFSLRYPLWHVKKFKLYYVTMDELTRAALWYCVDGIIEDSTLHGIKAVRECENIKISNCDIISPEFGWKSKNISLVNTSIIAEYLFFDSKNISLDEVRMKGKYSFQYVDGLVIEHSLLDTKDAFWHSKNVTVKDSTIKGEYLGWFSEGLTLIRCTIIGTQPLCYCKNLKLIDCQMEDCDLAFEYSDVEARIFGKVDSIKNPHSGRIVVDEVGEIIQENSIMENNAVIEIAKD
ncbi:MAG: DUF3737 family protein [Bacilli bacterium]|nr:DUF3737 family protein [Bacilli bacterium]